MIDKLFGPIAERYATRAGGYSRIIHTGKRHGDNADMSIIELVDRVVVADEKGDAGETKAAKPAKPAKPAKAPKAEKAEKKSDKKAAVAEKAPKAKAKKAKGE